MGVTRVVRATAHRDIATGQALKLGVTSTASGLSLSIVGDSRVRVCGLSSHRGEVTFRFDGYVMRVPARTGTSAAELLTALKARMPEQYQVHVVEIGVEPSMVGFELRPATRNAQALVAAELGSDAYEL